MHSDAGEWKCNDSHLLCIWDGSSCKVNPKRLPDCKELCQAVLDNRGPECLGNCPSGQSSNTLYSEYCEPMTSSNQTKHQDHKHQDHHNYRKRKCRRN